MGKKVLITGAAGFVGYHLATRLLSETKDIQVTLVDNFFRSTNDHELSVLREDPRVSFIEADLADPAFFASFPGGFEHVYHLAAVNGTQLFYEIPHEVLRLNVLSLTNLLEWFRQRNVDGKLCFTSSNEAYAGGLNAYGKLPIPTPEAVPLVIEDPYNPRWSYGASKLIGELFVIHYAEQHNFRAVIVRPHNFYGPRAGAHHVIPEFSMRIARQIDPFSIFGHEETRSFCYIDDAVRAMVELMVSTATDKHPVETVHIGTDEETTIGALADKLFSIASWRPKEIVREPRRPGSVLRRLPHTGKIKELIGWEPQITLNDGLARTYEWYAMTGLERYRK